MNRNLKITLIAGAAALILCVGAFFTGLFIGSGAGGGEGNTTLKSTPNPRTFHLNDADVTPVVAFAADFSTNKSQWTPLHGGWRVTEVGSYQSTSINSEKNMTIAGSPTWTDYIAESTVKVLTHGPNGDFGLLVRVQDSDKNYFAGYSSDCNYDLSSCKNYWRIWKTGDGANEDLDKEPAGIVGEGEKYILRVWVIGDAIQLYVNGDLVASASDKSSYSAHYKWGKAGLYVFNSSAAFSNFRVLVAPPPATAVPEPTNIAAVKVRASATPGQAAPTTPSAEISPVYDITPIIDKIGNPFVIGGLIMLLVAIGVLVLVFKDNGLKAGSSHGSAHWATSREIKKANIGIGKRQLAAERKEAISTGKAPPTRFIIGKAEGQIIYLGEHQLAQHVLITATTGKGKSSLLIIPNILIERGNRSIFAIDPKNEIYDQTAGALSQTMEIWRFSPTEEGAEESHGYNPLAHIKTMSDARDFALCWIYNSAPDGGSSASKEGFWDRLAEQLITGVILHLIETEEEPPLSRLATAFTKMSFDQIRNLLEKSPSQAARDATSALFANIEKNGKMTGSIMTDLSGRFFPLLDPIIRQVTDVNELDFTRMTREPIALFLSIPDSEAKKLRAISACLLMQMIRSWVKVADKSPLKRLPTPVTCYLDEFANYGRIPDMETYITTLRSRGIGFIMAIQTHKQLDDVYGDRAAATIIGNATTHLVLGGGEQRDTEYYSKRLGKETIVVNSRSDSNTGTTGASSSFSQSLTGRDLMTADEIRQMEIGKVLMIFANVAPLLVQATPYFKDKNLLPLVGLPYKATHITKRMDYREAPNPAAQGTMRLEKGKGIKPGQFETKYTRDVESKPGNEPSLATDPDDEPDEFAP